MGQVKEFELFHGVVLAKLMRNDRPVSLRMVEVRPNEAWSTYKINDKALLLVKYGAQPRTTKAGTTWSFTFNANELERLRDERHHLALVCGVRQLEDVDTMQVCLLVPEHVQELLDLDGDQQGVTVSHKASQRKLRVKSGRVEKPVLITRGALANWEPDE